MVKETMAVKRSNYFYRYEVEEEWDVLDEQQYRDQLIIELEAYFADWDGNPDDPFAVSIQCVLRMSDSSTKACKQTWWLPLEKDVVGFTNSEEERAKLLAKYRKDFKTIALDKLWSFEAGSVGEKLTIN